MTITGRPPGTTADCRTMKLHNYLKPFNRKGARFRQIVSNRDGGMQEDQMMQWITSKWITKPIYVISELGVADLMCDGPKKLAELAEMAES